jgi:hypothetical protein
VNTYGGIAEKSMDKFAALISSFRYPGPRASGLHAPLKDVKNTLFVRYAALEPFFRLETSKEIKYDWFTYWRHYSLVMIMYLFLCHSYFCCRSILKAPEKGTSRRTAKKTGLGPELEF